VALAFLVARMLLESVFLPQRQTYRFSIVQGHILLQFPRVGHRDIFDLLLVKLMLCCKFVLPSSKLGGSCHVVTFMQCYDVGKS
jgi:hypothetical protein